MSGYCASVHFWKTPPMCSLQNRTFILFLVDGRARSVSVFETSSGLNESEIAFGITKTSVGSMLHL